MKKKCLIFCFFFLVSYFCSFAQTPEQKRDACYQQCSNRSSASLAGPCGCSDETCLTNYPSEKCSCNCDKQYNIDKQSQQNYSQQNQQTQVLLDKINQLKASNQSNDAAVIQAIARMEQALKDLIQEEQEDNADNSTGNTNTPPDNNNAISNGNSTSLTCPDDGKGNATDPTVVKYSQMAANEGVLWASDCAAYAIYKYFLNNGCYQESGAKTTTTKQQLIDGMANSLKNAQQTCTNNCNCQ